MRVVITGANSAVGQAILRCTAAPRSQPLTIVAAVRSDRAAAELPPLHGRASVARISYRDLKSLQSAFSGAEAVIHLPGILVEGPGSTYQEAHLVTTRSVVEVCRQSTVAKLVYVSAVGASPASANRYWRTKGEAEALVRTSGCAYTVLQVPLLLGRGTAGAAALRRHLSRRWTFLIGGGRHLQQPLDVDDLAWAALRAASPAVARNRTLELTGPSSLPDREILARAARLQGRRLRVWPLPEPLARFLLRVRQSPAAPGFSPDALEVITAGTRLDPKPAAAELGIRLTGIDEMLQKSLERE